ncbi:MAG: hypothetical protein O0X49_06490 [Methanocorpusculum sp.]|nr:hypothetical protein [Methanocorpusculum sp.]
MAEQGREQQAAELDLLLHQMDSMERQLRAVSQELRAIKEQLASSGPTKPEQRFVSGLVQKLENRLDSLRERLNDLRAHMAGWARDTLEQFKQAGVSALDKAMSALNVKGGLEQIHTGIQGCMEALRGGIRRVEQMGDELRQAGAHLHSAGRAAAGKGPARRLDTTQEGRFQSGLLAPMRAAVRGLSRMNNAALAAIGTVERLEQAAQAARKPSIREALAEKKAEAAARPAPEPSQARKPQEAAL